MSSHKVGFDSLQTGKQIATRHVHIVKNPALDMFRFPSNGKADSNASKVHAEIVAGTFRFPSNGKAYINIKELQLEESRYWFPFPSNGKAYINIFRNVLVISLCFSFDSLQTGKHISTQIVFIDFQSFRWRNVSIPFKRESIYQRYQSKSYDKRTIVSIPFKRESIYQPV